MQRGPIEPGDAGGKTVMVLTDDEEILEDLRGRLKDSGWSVRGGLQAGAWRQAIELGVPVLVRYSEEARSLNVASGLMHQGEE
jgi:hypothetical protein